MNEKTLIAKVAALNTATAAELKSMWKELFGEDCPPPFLKSMRPRLAYRIQELAFGGVAVSTRKRLQETAATAKGKKARLASDKLSIGTKLVREWQGVEHHVTVIDGGFDYRGIRYSSLTGISRAITGTSWNGPKFFGLRSEARRI